MTYRHEIDHARNGGSYSLHDFMCVLNCEEKSTELVKKNWERYSVITYEISVTELTLHCIMFTCFYRLIALWWLSVQGQKGGARSTVGWESKTKSSVNKSGRRGPDIVAVNPLTANYRFGSKLSNILCLSCVIVLPFALQGSNKRRLVFTLASSTTLNPHTKATVVTYTPTERLSVREWRIQPRFLQNRSCATSIKL